MIPPRILPLALDVTLTSQGKYLGIWESFVQSKLEHFPHKLRVSSALGFPSKTSAEITPDHRKLSQYIFGAQTQNNAQSRISIAVCHYWRYFHDALEKGGNRLPLPAPTKYQAFNSLRFA
jgi:hypothetical protein